MQRRPTELPTLPKDRPKWDGKIPKDETLQAWEDYFLLLYKALKQ